MRHSPSSRPLLPLCRHLSACLTFLLLILPAAPAQALENVTLQLRWRHQFQFAGYYAAQMQGYYREAGLAVDIREAEPGQDAVQAVLEGKAQYGVGTSDLLVHYHRGAPVLVLAVIFQHSPLAIAARRAAGIRNIHDLNGKKVMIEPGANELLGYLGRERVDTDSLALEPHSQTVQDLLDGRVDALSIYRTDELYELRKQGERVVVFTPESSGLDFYGDNLFSTQAELRQHQIGRASCRERVYVLV